MTRRLPWHPLAFAALIVLTAWLDAAVSPYAAVRSLVVALVVAAAITAIASLPLRSIQTGAIVATASLGVLWSKQLIATVVELAGRMGPLVIVWALVVVAAGVVVVRLVRRSRPTLDRESLTIVLNRASSLLLVAAVLLGLMTGRFAATIDDLDQGSGLADWPGGETGEPERPDIYVILLDGYPRSDVLEYAFALDNEPFLDALTDRGFEVAAVEPLGLPVDARERSVGAQPRVCRADSGHARRDRGTSAAAADASNDRRRQRRLRRRRASMATPPVGVGSGFEEVAPRLADVYVDGGQLNEFETSLITSTFAGAIVAALAPDFASAQQRDRIEYNLDVLADIAGTPGRAAGLHVRSRPGAAPARGLRRGRCPRSRSRSRSRSTPTRRRSEARIRTSSSIDIAPSCRI